MASLAVTRFALERDNQKPFAEFPLLTHDGHDDALSRPGGPMPESVCLAWVDRAGLAVYLLPPQAYRAYSEDAAFFAVCGASHTAVALSNHKYGEFLEDLPAALLDCESGWLDKYEFEAVLTGIAVEICSCVNFYDGDFTPVLGYAWFFDMLKPETGGEFGYRTGNVAVEMAIARALFRGSRLSDGEHKAAPFIETGDIIPATLLEHLGKDFESGVAHALSDYHSRYSEYVARTRVKKSKPKRSTRVRELLWNSYPHICGICGGQIDSFDEMHVDHIIPLSRGGKDILANLQLTHAKCNLEKGSAIPETDDGEEG